MSKAFNSEIGGLNRELLALKTEKAKRLENLTLAKQSVNITIQRAVSLQIKVKPLNDVHPLITYYLDIGNYDPADVMVIGGYPNKEYGLDNELCIYFSINSNSSYASIDAKLVLISTSMLDIEVS